MIPGLPPNLTASLSGGDSGRSSVAPSIAFGAFSVGSGRSRSTASAATSGNAPGAMPNAGGAGVPMSTLIVGGVALLIAGMAVASILRS